MSAKQEKLVRRMVKEGTKNVSFFNEIPSDAWNTQVYADGAGWNLKQLLTHIVNAEDSILRLILGVVETGRGVPEDFDLDAYNERKVNEAPEMSPAELVELFVARRAKTVQSVTGFSETDLLKEGNHPFLGYAKVEEMVKLMYLHVQIHIRDIRRVLDERN